MSTTSNGVLPYSGEAAERAGSPGQTPLGLGRGRRCARSRAQILGYGEWWGAITGWRGDLDVAEVKKGREKNFWCFWRGLVAVQWCFLRGFGVSVSVPTLRSSDGRHEETCTLPPLLLHQLLFGSTIGQSAPGLSRSGILCMFVFVPLLCIGGPSSSMPATFPMGSHSNRWLN